MRTDMERYGSERFLQIAYEDLCSRPASILDEIQTFFARHGVVYERSGEMPASFTVSIPRLNDPSAVERINGRVREMWGDSN
jgi:hypothetical protein